MFNLWARALAISSCIWDVCVCVAECGWVFVKMIAREIMEVQWWLESKKSQGNKTELCIAIPALILYSRRICTRALIRTHRFGQHMRTHARTSFNDRRRSPSYLHIITTTTIIWEERKKKEYHLLYSHMSINENVYACACVYNNCMRV